MLDCRRSWAWTILVLTFLAMSGLVPQAAADEPPGRVLSESLSYGLSEKVQMQIGELLAEKQSRTAAERKLDSSLILPLRQQDPRWTSLSSLARLPKIEHLDQRVEVDIEGDISAGLTQQLQAFHAHVTSNLPHYGVLRAQVPWRNLVALAALDEVHSIRPAAPWQTSVWQLPSDASDPSDAPNAALGGPNTTEGDVAHGADIARTDFSVDGSGISVGVMSDSVDQLAALQASGDLPAGVTVLAGQSGNPGSSEGTALLEIVHDLAPGADLFFATAKGGEAQMAQNILDLAAAGCDVIVDDVTYFAEAVFQDGVIAQAVETVSAAGVFYVSSAGNSGNLQSGTSGVYEGTYVPTALPGVLAGAGVSAHDFGSGDTGNVITEDALNDARFFTLQWSEPQDGASSDYDLFLLDAAGTAIIAASTNVQDGTQDPIEIIGSDGFDDTGFQLVVVLESGDEQFFHLNTHRGRLEHATSGQIFGHAAAASAISVAAVDVATAGGGLFVGGPANPVEAFSSDGPRAIFFESDGTPVDPAGATSTRSPTGSDKGFQPISRLHPLITAANRVLTATLGFEVFAGTSASAPHVAGLLALHLQHAPFLNQQALNFAFLQEALDIEAPGMDNVSGYGIPRADELLPHSQPGVEAVMPPADGIKTSEDGKVSTTVTYVLTAEPTADVTIEVISDPSDENEALPPVLEFNPADWFLPKSVIFQGVDDDVDDGDTPYSVLLRAINNGSNYDGVESDPIPGVNEDDDTAGISVSPTSGLITSDDGTTDTFDVVLDSEPLFDVTIDFRSEDSTEGLVSDDGSTFSESVSLTFTKENWDEPKTVTVQGQDDDVFTSGRSKASGVPGTFFQVVGTAIVTDDPVYSTLDPALITVTVFNVDAFVFSDGFETGDTSGWDVSVP